MATGGDRTQALRAYTFLYQEVLLYETSSCGKLEGQRYRNLTFRNAYYESFLYFKSEIYAGKFQASFFCLITFCDLFLEITSSVARLRCKWIVFLHRSVIFELNAYC